MCRDRRPAGRHSGDCGPTDRVHGPGAERDPAGDSGRNHDESNRLPTAVISADNLLFATWVNEAGEIAGFGIDENTFQIHAFVARPVGTPSTAGLNSPAADPVGELPQPLERIPGLRNTTLNRCMLVSLGLKPRLAESRGVVTMA
jgi:hypothetical protein